MTFSERNLNYRTQRAIKMSDVKTKSDELSNYIQKDDEKVQKRKNRSSKETRKKTKRINSTDQKVYFMTGNENTPSTSISFNCSDNDLNQDIVNDHGNLESYAASSKQTGLNYIDNNGNGNVDLNKNRKNSNSEILTQGVRHLNVTNKQVNNTDRYPVNEKVVDTNSSGKEDVKSEDNNSENSYSLSFESSESTKKERSNSTTNKSIQKETVNSETKEEFVNNSENKPGNEGEEKQVNGSKEAKRRTSVDLQYKKRPETISSAGPKEDQIFENKGKSDNTPDTYSDNFCSDSNSKIKSGNKPAVEKHRDDDDENTLTETSWPSYCQDKSEKSLDNQTEVDVQSKEQVNDNTQTEKTADDKIQTKNQVNGNILTKEHVDDIKVKEQVDEQNKSEQVLTTNERIEYENEHNSGKESASVKDHTNISLSIKESKSTSHTKNDIKNNSKVKIQEKQDDSDATLSDKSFPTYRSEEPLPEEHNENRDLRSVNKGSSDVSTSATTTQRDSIKHTLDINVRETQVNSKIPCTGNTDSQSNARKESNDLKNTEIVNTGTANSKGSDPDDTLEDIEPITNSLTPIEPITNSEAPIEPITNSEAPIEPIKNSEAPIEPITNSEAPIEPITNSVATIPIETITNDQLDKKVNMAKESFPRPAVKNSESDVEGEQTEGTATDKTNQNEEPVHVTNGDDGVFSDESDGETKDRVKQNADDDQDKINNVQTEKESNEWAIKDDFKKEYESENVENPTENQEDGKTSDEQNVSGQGQANADDKVKTEDEKINDNQVETGLSQDEEKNEPCELESVEQIRRNIQIDQAVDTVSELEVKVRDLMENMKDLLSDYNTRLNSQRLADFASDMDKFRGDFISMRDAYKKYESLFVFLNKCLKDLRTSGEEVNNLIAKRFREEDLTTWMESQQSFEEEKHQLREERIAIERSALAKASEARSSVARVAVAVAENNQLASEAEIEAAEAESLAKKAWESAELARKAVEEARKAAIEKRKAEEETRKRALERSQKKAEEEKKKREEEDKLLAEEAKQKGTTFQEERSRVDQEKAKKETERINPNNWPRNIYSVEPGDYDPGVGCIIRAVKGSLNREDVEVTRIDQDKGILEMTENEELVSNIIEIKPVDSEKNFTFELPMSISFPHCMPRGLPGKEPIIKQLLPSGKWAELPSAEIVFDDIKELRFVETRTRKFGTFAVILRLKRDTLTFTKKGNKVFSTVDPRVSFTCKPSMFRMNTNFNVEVQPVELSAVTDLKQRHHVECNDLLASSPILKFSIMNRKFAKPLLLTMPLPPNTSKPKRPQTATLANRNTAEGQEARPLTARPSTAFQSSSQEDDIDEEIHFLVRSNTEQTWTKIPDAKLFQAKNKDIVSFEIKEPCDRFLLLRTKNDLTCGQVERIAFMLETSIMYRTIQIFLRQKTDDPKEIILSSAQSNRVDRAVRKFEELGYEEGPSPSKDILVREGQVLEISFRGNIHSKDRECKLKLLFNTHIRSKLDFNVEEIEKFAQKSFHTYRGFAQIYSDIVSKQLHQSDHQTAGVPKKPPHVDIIKERLLLSELLINIPKPEPEPPKPLLTAPVKIHVEAPDTKDVLDYVAKELGDEWKMLAQLLNLKSVRIQAILRQNTANPDPKKIRYDMLVSWAKRIPRSANKLDLLATALMSCGRGDIASELRDKDVEYKQNMAKAYKETHLRRAFIKVAQNPYAVRGWMGIARRLGLSEAELKTVEESKSSVQEKCFQSLRSWQSEFGEQATLHMLTDRLRKCRYRQLAREIETIC